MQISKHIWALFLFIVLIFSTLSSVSVFGSSEAREIHLSSIVRESNSFPLVPKRGDFVPSKPPLFHYVCGGIGKLLPNDIPMEIITRSVSLLSALLTIFFTFLLSKHFNASYLSVYILISSHLFLSSAFDSKVDTLMTTFIVGGIYAWLVSKRAWCVLLLCLSVLTKGPLPFLITSLGVACLDKRFLIEKSKYLALGSLGGLLGCAWYVLVYASGDVETIIRQLWFENVARMVGDENISAKPWYFLFKSFVFAEPHLALTVAITAWLGGFKGIKNELSRSGLFFIITLIFLSFSSGKRSSYLLPVLPFFSLWLGAGIQQIVNGLTDLQRRRIITLGRCLTSLSLLIIAVLLFSIEFLKRYSIKDSQTFLLIHEYFTAHSISFQLLLIFALFFGILCESKTLTYPFIYVTLWISLSWLGSGVKGELRGFQKASNQIRDIVKGEKILLRRDRYDEYLDPLFYYLRDIAVTSGDAPFILGKRKDTINIDRVLFSHRQIGDVRAGVFEREIVLTQSLIPSLNQ